MGRKIYIPFIIILTFACSNAFSQTGEIRGRVLEKGGTAGVPFASVTALQGGAEVLSTKTDLDGNYVLKPLNPAKYDVKVTNIGYGDAITQNVLVTVDKASFVNFELATTVVTTKEAVVTEYAIPLIDKGSPSVQKTVSYEDIQAMPSRDVNSVASTAAAVGQADQGGDLNIRGSRSSGTAYYVDGIKMRGSGSTGLS